MVHDMEMLIYRHTSKRLEIRTALVDILFYDGKPIAAKLHQTHAGAVSAETRDHQGYLIAMDWLGELRTTKPVPEDRLVKLLRIDLGAITNMFLEVE